MGPEGKVADANHEAGGASTVNSGARPSELMQFTVDWNSSEDIERLLNQLRARRRDLFDGHRVPKARRDARFAACWQIMYTDIASVYADLLLSTVPCYYVYAHLDTSKVLDVRGQAGGHLWACAQRWLADQS